MERSVEETAVEAESAPPPTPEARRPRRFVQSKLSWHGPRVEAACTAAEGEREEMGDSDAESEGKGKRKRRRKSQPRAPRKTPVTNKEEHGLKSDSDFAQKGLERNLRRKQKKEPQDAVPLKAGNSKNCKVLDSMDSKKNCRRPKNKKNGETTPEKATTSCDSEPKVVDSQQRRNHNKSDGTKNLDGQNLHVNQPVVDLRLEAKIAAEENIRLSAGKQTHPFFTSWKASKRVPDAQDTMKVENRHLISCPPIHVFDTLGDDVVSLDWGNWVFKERTPLDLDGYHTLETNLSVFESSVEPLKLDTVSCEGMHLNPYSDEVKRNSSASAIASYVLPNGQDSKKLFSHTEVHISCNDSFSSRCPSFVDNEQQDNLFKERLSPYYRRCIYSPQCSLWTNKYQPENALEVCGNRESITFLSEWLKSWRERGLDTSKNFKYGDKYPIDDGEDSLYKNEYDTDEMDDDATLKNVLLITGPIGSGKSAAIYACAKEQGYEVIEVNASDLRNGSHVKQKYGEALESHGFNRWSSDDPIGSRRKNILDLLSSPPDTEEGRQIEDGSVEITSRTFNQDTTPAECSLDDETASYQVTNKTLILFEDVDTVFDEDRGFISTILKLAETSKRPIILTSNNKNPILPQVLDRSVLDFTLPSFGELLPHVYMVCASENICIPSHLLEQLIRLSLGDIRKTLMLLQFWCQGKRGTDRNMHFTYSPLPCDVDAAHLIMPRVIPWEFECELSKRVEEEISKTISAVEENLRVLEAVKQQELDSTESIDFLNHRNNVAKPIKTRKKRRLKRRDRSFPDPTEVSAHANNLEDFSDALDSPFKCARRTVKHRHGTVLTFQSDDQSDNDKLLLTNIIPDVSTEPLLQMQESPNDSEIPVYPLYQLLRDDIVRNPFENCEIASTSHICDTFKLHDVSCVPESSFVSVTETKRDGCLSTVVSSNNMSFSFADFIKSIHVPPGAEANNLDRAIIESSKCLSKNVGNSFELDAESVHGNEEQGDFQNEESEAPANVCHLMDECSRADMLVPGKNSNCCLEVGSVPETWRNLRSRHEDLKQYLTTNQKDAALIVKFASGLTDLISKTDIMFSTCTPLVSDVLEPSRTPSVEPDAFFSYWERLEIGSSYAQHGLRFYTNKCAIIGSNLGFDSTLNLAQEMLASSSNTMALGKLLTQGHSPCQNSYVEGCLHTKAPRCGMSIGRELESELYNVILPVVPTRLSMTLRGPAFHDYLSFMSQISKLECSRLSESINKSHQRRSRASKHYLSSCSLPLSPEDVELLAQSNCFKD